MHTFTTLSFPMDRQHNTDLSEDRPPTPPPHYNIPRSAIRRAPASTDTLTPPQRSVRFALHDSEGQHHGHQYSASDHGCAFTRIDVTYRPTTCQPPAYQPRRRPPPPQPPEPPPHVSTVPSTAWAHRRTTPAHLHTRWDFGLRIPVRPRGPRPESSPNDGSRKYKTRYCSQAQGQANRIPISHAYAHGEMQQSGYIRGSPVEPWT